MIETIEPLLASHPVFRNLNPAHVKLIAGRVSNVILNADKFIFRYIYIRPSEKI